MVHSTYKAKLKKRPACVREMVRLAIEVAELAIQSGCHVVEWPQPNGLWQEPLWVQFEEHCNLRRCYFDGYASRVRGDKELIRKRRVISTTSLRELQLFSQQRCSGDHVHEHAEGSMTKGTGHYNRQFADLVMETFFPNSFYKTVPSSVATTGLA